MKVNFKQFPVYTGISKKQKVVIDVSEQLANAIYQNVPGIVAHVLAEKIYKSDGELEIDGQEADVLKSTANLFTGAFADSLNDILEGGKQ